MSIKGLSDIVRLPRLGKIRLGIKVQGQESDYPKRVDYFVCPENVQKLYGEKPTTLPISFPSSDPDIVAPQHYKMYGRTHGLICKGDGERSYAKVDKHTGTYADRNTEEWVYEDMICEGEECPEFQAKNCKRVMTLLVVLHEVPGLGVYQLDTSNRHSIINTNSILRLLQTMTRGRFAMVPLKMSLAKDERQTPEGKRNIECLVFLKDDIRPMDLLKGAAVTNLLVEGIDENEAPDDMYPPRILETADKTAAHVVDSKAHVVSSGAPATAPPATAPPAAAPPAGAPPADGKKTRQSKSTRSLAGAPPSSANAPLISPELLKAWLDLRTLQKDCVIDDGLIRGGFRKYDRKLIVPKGALTDSPPPWATLAMVNNMIGKLQSYQKSMQKTKKLAEHIGGKQVTPEEPTVPGTGTEKKPGEVMDI
jgi:hypothetical protein